MIWHRLAGMDAKLTGLEVAQRQIGEQVAELRTTIERNSVEIKQSAEKTKQVLDRVLSACGEIMGAIADKTNNKADADKGHESEAEGSEADVSESEASEADGSEESEADAVSAYTYNIRVW